MSLLIHSGAALTDLNVTGTKRDDISDVLLASLYVENNMLGLTPVGAEFADEQLKWVEDALNQFKITDTAGQTAASTQMTVSLSDASVLDLGYVLQEDLQLGSGEYVQITNIAGTTVTMTRGYGGSTATTHSASAVWRIIDEATYQNSDLGKDKSRARVSKTNFLNRFEMNVNLASEQIERSRAGYVPGVRDEMSYQFLQRWLEKKRNMQQAYWFAIAATGAPIGDYETMWGLWKWLDGTANGTASPITTAESLTDVVLNTIVKNILRQGAASNLIACGPNMIERIGQLYQDRLRTERNDRGRGFFAQYFTPSMANEHRLVNDPYMMDATGSAQVAVLDMGRLWIRPFIGQFAYTIMAPTLRDGDAVRALFKWSLEVRNTGTDIGFAHQIHTNLS
jgi:hypothetical protein